MYTYHDFFGTFIILNIRAVQSIQKQYGPPCISAFFQAATIGKALCKITIHNLERDLRLRYLTKFILIVIDLQI